MTELEAVRVFANPGYCPAKKTRIHKDKWYLVRMQNVERDQGDGVYLGEGEYVELLPGNEARSRRDAHLNHCNGIAEWKGPVYKLDAHPYNWENARTTYHPTAEDLDRAIIAFQDSHRKWISDMERQRVHYVEMADADRIVDHAKRTGVGIARINDPAWVAEKIEWYNELAAKVQHTIDANRNLPWRFETTQVK